MWLVVLGGGGSISSRDKNGGFSMADEDFIVVAFVLSWLLIMRIGWGTEMSNGLRTYMIDMGEWNTHDLVYGSGLVELRHNLVGSWL